MKVLVDTNSAILLDAGYTKNLKDVTVDDKEELIRILFLHYTIYRSKAELDQLKLGLNILGVADEMKRNGKKLHPYFTHNEQQISAGLCELHCSNCHSARFA